MHSRLPIENYIQGSYENRILRTLQWRLTVAEAEHLKILKQTLSPNTKRFFISSIKDKISELKARILLMQEV